MSPSPPLVRPRRRLRPALAGVALVFFAAAPARAFDPCVDGAGVGDDLCRDIHDVQVNIPSPLTEALFHLDEDADRFLDIAVIAGGCLPEELYSLPIDVTLVGRANTPGASDREVNLHGMFELPRDAFDCSYIDPEDVEEAWLPVPLDAPEVRAWATGLMREGREQAYTWRVRVTVDPTEGAPDWFGVLHEDVNDNGYYEFDNNSATSTTVGAPYVPLANALVVGGAERGRLVSPVAPLELEHPSCPGALAATSGDFLIQPDGSAGGWSPVLYHIATTGPTPRASTLCLVPDWGTWRSDGLPLIVSDVSTSRAVSEGTLAGLDASYDFTLSPDGLHMNHVDVTLPPGVSAHRLGPGGAWNAGSTRGVRVLRQLAEENAPAGGGPQHAFDDVADVFADFEGWAFTTESLPFAIGGAFRIRAGGAIEDADLEGPYTAYWLREPTKSGAYTTFGPLDALRNGKLGKGPVSNDVRMKSVQIACARLNGFGLFATLGFSAGAGETHYPAMELSWSEAPAALDAATCLAQQGDFLGTYGAASYGVIQGRLTPNALALPGTGTHMSARWYFNASCPGCGPAVGDLEERSRAIAGLKVQADGTLVGTTTLGGGDSAWGPKETSHAAALRIFARDDEGESARLVVPGFITGGVTDVVADYLMGAWSPVADPGHVPTNTYAHRRRDDAETARGNGFFAGETVGPETYRDAGEQPATGAGSSLVNNDMSFAVGGPWTYQGGAFAAEQATHRVAAKSATTKYVLAPQGITGAFNFAPPAPQPAMYGYPVSLTRFAFRMRESRMDTYSWIDGALSLPGRAGFEIPFVSLELQCTGHLGGGRVDRSRLAALPEAKRRLAGWSAPFDVNDFAFEPAAAAGQCAAGNRTLGAGGLASLVDLTTPLDLYAFWTAAGEPATTPRPPTVRGKTFVEFGKVPAMRGFGLAVDAAQVALKPLVATTDTARGWFELGGDLALPFWKMPKVVVRVQNHAGASGLVADPTLVRRQGAFAEWDAKSNHLLQSAAQKLAKPTGIDGVVWEGARIDVRFPWMFDIDFPMRWRPEPEGARFVAGGEGPGKDLAVIKVAGAADYTTPERTKISFGASADLDRLSLASFVPINVDLEDEKSVHTLDDFLRSNLKLGDVYCPPPLPGVAAEGDQGPLWCGVKYLKKPSDILAKAVGGMFDNFLQGALNALMDATIAAPNGPLDQYGNLLAFIQQAPMGLVNAGFAEVSKLIDRAVAGLTGELSTAVRTLYTTARAKVEGAYLTLNVATPDLSPAGLAQLASLDAELATLAGTLQTLSTQVKGAGSLVTEVQAKVDLVRTTLVGPNGNGGLAKELFDKLVEAECWTKTLRKLLNDTRSDVGDPATECPTQWAQVATASDVTGLFTNSQNNKIYKRIEELISTIQQILGAFRRPEIASIANAAESFLGVDLASFKTAINDVGEVAGKIDDRVRASWTAIQTALGSLQAKFQTLAKPINDLLQTVQTQVTNAKVGAATLTVKIKAIADGLGTLTKPGGSIDKLVQPVLAFAGAVVDRPLTLIDALRARIKELQGCAGDPQSCLPVPASFTARAADFVSFDQVLNDVLAKALAPLGVTGAQWVYPDGTTIVNKLASLVRQPIDGLIATVQGQIGDVVQGLVKALPFPTKDELRQLITHLILGSDLVKSIDKLVHDGLVLVTSEIDKLAGKLLQQLNNFVKAVIGEILKTLDALIDGVKAEITGALGFSGAGIDGYALIKGNDLERIHLDANFTSSPSKSSKSADEEKKRKDEDSGFRAALDIVSWAANDKGKRCGIAPEDAKGMFDATISAFDLPFKLGTGSGMKIKELTIGFTLDKMIPIGIRGLLITTGTLDFKAFELRDIRFAMGFGAIENYLGASASGTFSGYDIGVAFYAGNSCDPGLLKVIDPEFAGFVEIPPDKPLRGGYVRGSASIPIYNVGCLLRVGAGADFGAWIFDGSVGGLIGGSVFGQLVCMVSVRGGVRMGLNVNTDNGKVSFKGEAWVAGGLGACSPEKWNTVARSREDGGFCFTFDSVIQCSYVDEFKIDKMDISGPH